MCMMIEAALNQYNVYVRRVYFIGRNFHDFTKLLDVREIFAKSYFWGHSRNID